MSSGLFGAQNVAEDQTPFRFATVTESGTEWRLKRNCALTPQQVGSFFLLLCGLSLGIGAFFWLQGAILVLPFTALELLLVGFAFLMYARHATDGECIRLEPHRLVVEQETAGRLLRTEFAREWVRVEPQASSAALIEVSAGHTRVTVGRHLRADLRPALAREMRQVLRSRCRTVDARDVHSGQGSENLV